MAERESVPGTPAGDDVVTVEGLSIAAGERQLIDEVSFRIAPRQRVGIIGASGSGKTLTCLAIAGLLPAGLRASGSVRLAGFPQNTLTASERALASVRGRLAGMVFQEPMTALNPTMRVDRQVAEAMRTHGNRPPRSAERRQVRRLLEQVGLADSARIAASFPHQLSGGQRQRIVMAIALANNPRVLICDEPTTALDVSVQARVLDLVDERTTAMGSALLFISHDLAVVASVCDVLLVMWQGRIVERGPVVDVLTHPQHPHTRQLLVDSDLRVPSDPESAARRLRAGGDES